MSDVLSRTALGLRRAARSLPASRRCSSALRAWAAPTFTTATLVGDWAADGRTGDGPGRRRSASARTELIPGA